ncbi:phospholipase D family protein [Chloroflexota bacterium]
MNFTIIDKQWYSVFQRNTELARQNSLLISPFLRKETLEKLLGDNPKDVRVLTRFNLDEMSRGVNDVKALEYLLEVGAQVKGIRHLHSKVYVFNASNAIVTSANLTQAALIRNAEFGVESSDREFVQAAIEYFESLWSKAGLVLDKSLLNQWKQRIKTAVSSKGNTIPAKLGDQGIDLGFDAPSESDEFEATIGILPGQWFIKFFGTGHDRASREMSILDEVRRSACHEVLSYPKGKRPRQVKDGDLVFVGRMVSEPNDIMIFGRTLGMKHNQQKDNATAADIRKRQWRKDWPHYVRVSRTEFINGSLNDGISLYDLMRDLGPDVFASTYANKLSGKGNTNPRKAYLRQASVRLSTQGAQILNSRLEDAFSRLGQISEKELLEVD